MGRTGINENSLVVVSWLFGPLIVHSAVYFGRYIVKIHVCHTFLWCAYCNRSRVHQWTWRL